MTRAPSRLTVPTVRAPYIQLSIAAALLAAGGCRTPPRQGGRAHADGVELVAPQDPAAASRQTIARTQFLFRPAARHFPQIPPSPSVAPGGPALPPSAGPPALVTYERIEQEIAPAQADAAASIRAKARALRPVQYIGIALILFALACSYPPIFAVVGSRTTQALCLLAGGAMALSPVLVPGRETLILVFGIAVPALWWIAHRHGELRARSSPS